MDWTFFITIAVLWLLSPLILLVALIVARRQVRMLRERLASRLESEPPLTVSSPVSHVGGMGANNARYAPADLENLLLLRMELEKLLEAGELPKNRHQQLVSQLDLLWERHLREGGAWPGNEVWEQRRALAWRLLGQALENPPGSPPWLAAIPPISPALPAPPAAVIIPPTMVRNDPPPVLSPPPVISPPPPAWKSWPLESVEPSPPPLSDTPLSPEFEPEPIKPANWRSTAETASSSRKPVPETVTVDVADWRPAAPSPLERALTAVSGWPKLIAPFLAQNIGWFVGGFCFIAGALFLIANTSGFVNALVVFISLFGAGAFLLWAGYQFRRQRVELAVASTMLLTLGMLLAPLVLAVAARLVNAARGDPLLLLVSVVVVVITLAAFAWAAALSSMLVDRVLQGRYAWLLTGLGAAQLVLPLAQFAPYWQVLMVWHALLLGVLGYALWTFSGEWLRQLFVDRRLTTYYAVGMLVYTAMVSFVHLTWLWPATLPEGYAGPFLMALCGLLFPIDAALKEWVEKYTFLSRFSFVLYGLSAVAIAVASQSTLPLALALALGGALYGWMTWRYRTLPPLYLLFGCLVGLYGLGLLHLVPPAWRGLAAEPGLLALLGCARWASPRSRAIALQCLMVGGVLLVGVIAWSLTWNPPSALSFLTAVIGTALAYIGVQSLLALPEMEPRWAYAGYLVTVLAAVAVVCAPSWSGSGWGMQTAWGWLALAALWAGLGLQQRGQSSINCFVWLGSAQWNVALALALAGISLGSNLLGRLEPILLLAVAGALLLWLSLSLRRQALFYGVLACGAGIGALVKQGFFPGPSTGLIEFVLVLAIWGLLWRLNWRFRARRALADNQPDAGSDGDDSASCPSLIAVVGAPLEQAMASLWVLGLIKLSLRLVDGGAVSAAWPVTAGVGVVAGLVLIGYFHRFSWVALPFLLGLAGVVVGLVWFEWLGLGVGAAAVLYALLVWRASVAVLEHPTTWRLAQVMGFTVPGGAGGSRQIQQSLHRCAMAVAVTAVGASLALMLLKAPVVELLPILGSSLLLFIATGWHYRSVFHAYAALITLTLTAWLLDAGWFGLELLGLGQPLLNVVLSALMALAWLALRPEKTAPFAYWRTPLQLVSAALYLLALAGATLAALAGDARLPVLLALLCVALFPVARPWRNAAGWRGLGLALLSSALAWSLVGWGDFDRSTEIWIAVVWGYALWFDGNLLLPRWNARQPDWAVAPEFWPLLGLVCVLAGSAVGWASGDFSLSAALAALTPYLFLLLRNTTWPGMAWLAVAVLTASGLSAGLTLNWWNPLPGGSDVLGVLSECTAALLWLNLLWLLIPVWRRHGRMLASWLDWRRDYLLEPLFWLPFGVLGVVLARLWVLEIGLFWVASPAEPASWRLVGVALLLAASAGHGFKIRPTRLPAHSLLLALPAVIAAVLLALAPSPVWLPLLVALWDGALLLAWRHGSYRLEAWRSALEFWLAVLPVASLALLFIVPGVAWDHVTGSLLALAVIMLAQGWWRERSIQLKIGLLLALAGSYVIWLSGATSTFWAALFGLAPWYALQTVLLLWGLRAVRSRLEARLNAVTTQSDEARLSQVDELAHTLRESIPWLLVFSLLWLGLHAWGLLAYRAGWGSLAWYFGATVDPLAAGATLLALAAQTGMKAWRQVQEPKWVYATAALLGLLAAYGRLAVLGLTPFTVADTAGLMMAAYTIFLLHQFTLSRPLYHLAVLLPLLALATAPWQLASPWFGAALLAAAVLYLSLAGALRNPLPMYLGVLALNGAVYLWAPLWAERYGLWQFYIVPAAVSVLALLHLHQRELRPGVLSGARLAALSALYAGAGLDVFLRPELWVFVLALALALSGVIFGIALRVRAFLYAGVAFLVLNVAGQLIRFYPEQGFSRALILIGLGTVITLGMVMFNLRREAIMQRIRIMRADLAAWE